MLNVKISTEPWIEPRTLWLEGRDLVNCANHVAMAPGKNLRTQVGISEISAQIRWPLLQISADMRDLGFKSQSTCESLGSDVGRNSRLRVK